MKILNRSQGSITLEAAIIMPLFISFLLFLITMVRIALVDFALHQMVTETSKQAASQMYLAQLTYDQLQNSELGNITDQLDEISEDIDNALKSTRERLRNLDIILEKFGDVLPDEINQILQLPGEIEDQIVGFYNSALGKLFLPLIEIHADEKVLNLDYLYVTKVVFPNLKDLDQPYVGIEVRYDLPLHLPFIDKTLSFHHQAYERAWIGDYYSNNLVSTNPYIKDPTPTDPREEPNEDQPTLRIHSISSPVQRGRSVRIIAKGPANETASISLYYKSGFEKEVNCTSNHEGWFHCDIRIGGNSKEGEFEAIMQVAQLVDRGSFIVLSKDNFNR